MRASRNGRAWARASIRWVTLVAVGFVVTPGVPVRAQGGGTPEQLIYRPKTRHPLTLVEVYAEGMLFWNKKLTDHEANTLAMNVIEAGKREGLDARLIISLLAVEGRIQQAHTKGKSVVIGNQEARTVIGSASKDLAARIHHAADTGKKGEAAVKEALSARGATLPASQSKGYAGRVLSNYKKMCGQG